MIVHYALTMSKVRVDYQAYLLRLWGKDHQQSWFFSITRIKEPGEQIYFATLDELLLYLVAQCAQSPLGEEAKEIDV